MRRKSFLISPTTFKLLNFEKWTQLVLRNLKFGDEIFQFFRTLRIASQFTNRIFTCTPWIQILFLTLPPCPWTGFCPCDPRSLPCPLCVRRSPGLPHPSPHRVPSLLEAHSAGPRDASLCAPRSSPGNPWVRKFLHQFIRQTKKAILFVKIHIRSGHQLNFFIMIF